ncbi:MAG: hypothetical protein IEMM0008_1291 [bacterium]|nr:MAG: hypothetical protein IEMM0008_1291 [bacterium]
MIFEVYNSVNEFPEKHLTDEENSLERSLKVWLTPFPVHRVRVRKNYSANKNEIGIDVELDSTLTSEQIYNKIVYRIFKTLHIDLITLENNGNRSNFPYFFYGEKIILNYKCSFFIDVPNKSYLKGESQFR